MERIQQTIQEMLVDRGYDNFIYNAEEYENYITKEDGSILAIFLLDDAKVGVKSIKEILDAVEGNTNHVIFVYKSDMTTFAKQFLNENFNDTIRIELFSYKELIFNIMKHEYVPHHEIVSQNKKLDLMKAFKITKEGQFPKILQTDPVVKYLGGKKGDLIKIYRNSEITGTSIYYRLCV